MAKAIGLDAASSADYIQLYHGNAELLMESLEMVQQTATVILAGIAPKPEKTQEFEPRQSETESASLNPPPMAESATAESVPF